MSENVENEQPVEEPKPQQESAVVPDSSGDSDNLSRDVENFMMAGKKLLDSVFSEVTSKIERKLIDYLKQMGK
jgi:hypothetical protein